MSAFDVALRLVVGLQALGVVVAFAAILWGLLAGWWEERRWRRDERWALAELREREARKAAEVAELDRWLAL